MYDYAFYFFYWLYSRRKEVNPKGSAVYGLSVTVLIHLFFVVTVINKVFNINLLHLLAGEGRKRLFWLPFILILGYLIQLVYNKRADIAISKYHGVDFKESRHFLMFVLIFGVPLVIGCILAIRR